MTRARLLAAAVVLAAVGAALVVAGVTRGESAHRALPREYDAPISIPVAPRPSTPVQQPVVASGSDGTSVPTRVDIGALRVHAPVVPVGSTAGGQVEIPARPATLGWWSAGAAPGAPNGSAVIVGHVDSARSGPGALFHLDRVRRGQRVDVRDASGQVASYRIGALHVVDKTSGLPRSLFASDGPPRLVLITCGGPFDRETRSYEDNIVAVADRVGL